MTKKTHYSASDLSKVLPKEVSDLYKVVKLSKRSTAAIVVGNFGKINFKTLTLKKAEYLVKNGFPFLEKLPTKKSKKEAEEV